MPSLQIQDFSGGLWIPGEAGSSNEQPGFAVPSNALLKADNVEYLPSGGVRGRRGRTLRNGTVLADTEILALWRHYGRTGQASSIKTPTNATNDSSVGSVAWSDAQYSFSSSEVPAYVTLTAGQISRYLYLSRLYFAVPTDATITGVQVDVLRSAQAGGSGAIRDSSIRLTKDGTAVGDSKALTDQNWPDTGYEWQSYGGPADLWGTTLTPAEVNAVAFGVMLSVTATAAMTAQVDLVRITVWYTTASDTRRFLVATRKDWGSYVSTRLWHEASTGYFTQLGAASYTSHRPTFVFWPARNMSFVFTGGQELLTYNGALAAVVPSIVADVTMTPRTGPYAALFKDRLYATDPAELNYSVYASEILDETTWKPDAHLNVSDPQGGTIQGLEAWGDSLWILKDTSIWRWTGDVSLDAGIAPLSQVSDRGCVAPATVQVTPWGVVYLSADGLYAMTGEGEIELSAPIRSLFASRSTQNVYTTAVGVYHARRDCYYLKLDPTQDECYVLHRVQVPARGGVQSVFAWARIPILPLNAGCSWAGEQDQGELFAGGLDGFIRELDTGTTDEGTAIAASLQTMFRPLSPDRVLGRVYEAEAIYRGTLALTGSLYYDQATSGQVALALGTAVAAPAFQYPKETVVDLANLGRFVSVGVENASDGPEFELHELSLSMQLRSRRR